MAVPFKQLPVTRRCTCVKFSVVVDTVSTVGTLAEVTLVTAVSPFF